MSARRGSPDDATGLLPFGDESPSDTPSTSAAPTEDPRRVFLGWEGPILPAACSWLRSEFGEDLSGLLVALPGSRGVRRLSELLALEATPGWRPPRIVTQGTLVDELVALERPAAGRLARTLAWRRALEALSAFDLERVARGSTRRRDAETRLRLAETLRGLHGLLAPEGLDFEDLMREDVGPEHESERSRWSVLARAQALWRAELDTAGLCDPHEGRRAAIQAGRVADDREVVLIGVADMNELLADAIARLGAKATALVAAPEELADGFDPVGRIVPSYWTEHDVPLPVARWFVEEKPADQADRVEALLGEWSETHAAEEITVGLADEEVAPYLERRLRAAGARLRNAAGTPMAATRPYKLLAATVDYLENRGYGEFAALVRHPDAVPCLTDDKDPAEVLDRYHEEHLPRHARGDWAGSKKKAHGVRSLARSLAELLGPLAGTDHRELGAWAEETRAFLLRIYAPNSSDALGAPEAPNNPAQLDPNVEEQRVLAAALRILSAGLEEVGEVPPALVGGEVSASETLRLVLRALRGKSVPPSPPAAGQPTVEALGWLELPLDDAPALVVTGFNEGRVPQSIQGDAFLPDGLRARLGLPDNDARLARDVYATCICLATRDTGDVAFVTGRRARSGDPLVPSRIAFQVPLAEITERIRRFLPSEAHPEPAQVTEEVLPAPLARRAESPKVERMSVTSFRRFLESPYLFYLEHVLRLRTRDDRARELDPMRFGTFAHDVLQAFGEHELKDSRSAETIEDFLVETAQSLARDRFGQEPLPTIALQLEQLKYRFRRFSEVQSWRRAEGWRILRAEWKPEPGHPFVVDGEPMLLRGKLDRLDAHEDGRWAILDYKTGEVGRTPEVVARERGRWKDLQLPLYRLLAEPLAREHGLEGTPQLGYFHLGKDEEHIGLKLVEGWTEEDFADAIRTAETVVRRVRRGDFFDIGQAKPFDEIFKALLGKGLLHTTSDEEDHA